MSDPRLEDGARSASTSIKTPGSVIQQFLASLTAACLALDELDIRRLRNNDQYIAKMNRLMVPMFTSPTAGEGDAGGGDTGPCTFFLVIQRLDVFGPFLQERNADKRKEKERN